MNIDPLAELMPDQSPYNYAFNNPVFWIDPDGRMPEEGDAGGGDLSGGEENQTPSKNVKVTTITSKVDEHNMTYITQTTYDTTYTKNDEGGMDVESIISETTNVVDANGVTTYGETTSKTESYNLSADGIKGEVNESKSSSSTQNTTPLNKWTSVVSNFNKNNKNNTYNQNLLTNGGRLTTIAFAAGSLPIAIKGGVSITIPAELAELFSAIGIPVTGSLAGGLTGGGTLMAFGTGSWNEFKIMYDSKLIYDGNLVKDFKNSSTTRKSIGPTSFIELFNTSKWKEFFNGGK